MTAGVTFGIDGKRCRNRDRIVEILSFTKRNQEELAELLSVREEEEEGF